MHGSNGGYGGRAGSLMAIFDNTIRGAQSYHAGYHHRPAFWLRGTPAEQARLHGQRRPEPDRFGRGAR